ncbi:MAG: hypothetical protein KGL39_14415 [Patescibacteria group bacterium]|nr:hypothetical protein [Patescibacteria group bacterium]
MESLLQQLVVNHLLALPIVSAIIGGCLSRIDSLILFLLRFIPRERIDAALDAIDAAAKARVDADAKKAGEDTQIKHD